MRPTSPAPVANASRNQGVPDFSSDVGRKKFGFSHEEIDDSTAYYEGQFKLYQRCGEGTLHSPDTGSKYVGQFQADQFHGAGDQTWSDGSRFIGQWKNGQKNGAGVYIGTDQLKYDGQWEDGRRHGQGMQEYCNDDKYKGWWFHGLCSGSGTYYFADGSRYEGAWANGRYDGPGMLYSADGQRERQWHSSGLLMKREVLPPGNAPKTGSKRVILSGKATLGQTRDEMHKPTVLPRPQPSKYLIRRETAGSDLSAPPIRPKTASALMAATQQRAKTAESMFSTTDGGRTEAEDMRLCTAGGDSFITEEMTTPEPTKMDSRERDRLDELVQLRQGISSA